MLRLLRVVCAALLAALAASCVQQMSSQPHVRPLEENAFFPGGQSARPVVPGTVPSGYTRMNGRVEAEAAVDEGATNFPSPVTRELLERGRERYDIYCAVCHARTGEGSGMIVWRGFSRPPSLLQDRLRDAPVGHFYAVITKGFGAMPSYAVQIEPQDRWAIIAYIRALQLSQHAALDDVPPEPRQRLENEPR